MSGRHHYVFAVGSFGSAALILAERPLAGLVVAGVAAVIGVAVAYVATRGRR